MDDSTVCNSCGMSFFSSVRPEGIFGCHPVSCRKRHKITPPLDQFSNLSSSATSSSATRMIPLRNQTTTFRTALDEILPAPPFPLSGLALFLLWSRQALEIRKLVEGGGGGGNLVSFTVGSISGRFLSCGDPSTFCTLCKHRNTMRCLQPMLSGCRSMIDSFFVPLFPSPLFFLFLFLFLFLTVALFSLRDGWSDRCGGL